MESVIRIGNEVVLLTSVVVVYGSSTQCPEPVLDMNTCDTMDAFRNCVYAMVSLMKRNPRTCGVEYYW